MPSVKHLQLSLAALLSLLLSLGQPLPLHDFSLSETSGEELQDAGIKPLKWHSIARHLHEDVMSLRDEQFQSAFGDTNMNMTDFANIRIQTPLIEQADGCLPRDFSEQRCLQRIYSGLSTYREYMSYVERENLTATLITKVKDSTTNLLNIIKEKTDKVREPSPLTTLPDGSAWTRNKVTHTVLYNFAEFVKDTSRAIYYMNKSKKGKSHNRDVLKDLELHSAKHPQE